MKIHKQKLILLLIFSYIILIEIVASLKSPVTNMNKNYSQYNQPSTPSLILTFRKLNVRSPHLNNSKITVVVKTVPASSCSSSLVFANKTAYQISKPRLVKNGIACFYGESITISECLKQFSIHILQLPESGDDKKRLVSIKILEDQLSEIKQRKNTFSSGNENIQLIWQAKLQFENTQEHEHQYDRSLEDFDDLNLFSNEQSNQILSRKIYSPAVRGQSRKKRLASRANSRKGKRYQLVSQSPHKLTMDTNQTVINVGKKIRLMSPTKNGLQNRGLKEFRRQVQHHQINKQQLGRQKLDDELKDGIKESKESVYEKRRNSLKDNIKTPMTPQNKLSSGQSFTKKRMESMFDKINIKSLLFSSMVGLIGGVVSTQF